MAVRYIEFKKFVGAFKYAKISHIKSIHYEHPNKTILKSKVIFFPLDSPALVKDPTKIVCSKRTVMISKHKTHAGALA